VHEYFFTPEQWQAIAGFPYKQAYCVTSKIHTPPDGFGKLMSMVKPRMAVAYHYWNHRDIELEKYGGVRKTYDGPLTMGTSKAWDTAPRGEPDTGLSSKWLTEGALKGVIPPPKQPLD